MKRPEAIKIPGLVALRGPLSQFFSGLYLKPLDDAFDNMDVTYLRYQDDIVILCKTKRQMNRCRRRMMQILHEGQLCLSRKKSRMGSIDKGFHFLGIDCPPTQPEDNTNRTQEKNAFATRACVAQLSPTMGPFLHIRCLSQYALFRIREQFGRRASKSSRWSTMDFLPNQLDAICTALSFGG